MSSVFHGKSIYNGITFGRLSIFHKKDFHIVKEEVEDSKVEIKRFQDAILKAEVELEEVYHKTLGELGPDVAGIFKAQQMVLKDPQFYQQVIDIIEKENMNVEYGILSTKVSLVSLFETIKDEYIKERAADIEDVVVRLLGILYNEHHDIEVEGKSTILISDDLTPGELMAIDCNLLKGIILYKGSENSHMAIIARNKNIPTLIQSDLKPEEHYHHKSAVLDAENGIVYVEPEQDIILKYQNRFITKE
ncbi:hypothetical protein I5677_06635 [Mobilitalea sibirica]|uniref:Phosphoenolpyruvate-protein phosphotransferase n=1 Tax=Mobilitalea sibirica TaxID=1462919 RepID=A0A8J7H1V7_9FIRM|nr:phosphoenolpyruvate-utilizing N-terminal domain-containing protein [Mobilitalea sibirica]MBH1940559.1 hypothetical protein [Mobilitalea sibirica]